jgi:hypothetical protein
MSIVTTLRCECNPGYNYASTSTFRAHKVSKRHVEWGKNGDVKQLRIRLAESQTEVARLNKRVHEQEHMLENPRKRRVSDRTKKEVAAQAEWRCSDCKNMLTANFEIDHIKPLFKGGSNDKDNLCAKCPECHREKTYADTSHPPDQTAAAEQQETEPDTAQQEKMLSDNPTSKLGKQNRRGTPTRRRWK